MNRKTFWVVMWLLLLLIGLVYIFGGGHAGMAAPNAVRFVDEGAAPISGNVRVLCYQTPSAPPSADLRLTVTNGDPTSPLPASCSYLAALREITIVSSSKENHGPAYTVYFTSFSPSDSAPIAATGDIVISSANRLTLFNVVVSMAWDPAAGSQQLTPGQLRQALRGASAYLYDLTEGQMAFGPLSIHTGGDSWQGADIRLLPANDRRPSSFVGGISDSARLYDGGTATTFYTPAEIYLGRAWDGALGAADPDLGRWTQVVTGTRTITHEWAHYALFLYDEYQQTDSGSRYCICATLPAGCGLGTLDGSAMAYHYTAGEFWHLITHISEYDKNICEATWNWHFHGNTDWKVLDNWGTIQGKAVGAFNFPTVLAKQNPTLAADFFGRTPGYALFLPTAARGGPPTTGPAQEPQITVQTEGALSTTRWPFSEFYLYENGYQNPTRILPMGRVRGGHSGSGTVGAITLLGVRQNDRARIFVEQFDDGALYSFPAGAGDEATPFDDGLTVQARKQSWDYALDHRFGVLDGVVVDAAFQLDASLSQPPIIQLCAIDPTIGCHTGWQKEMTLEIGSSTKWTHTFTAAEIGLAELPRFVVVRVVAEEKDLEGDIVQWLQVSGGVGPGHVDGIAPLVDGEVMLNTGQAVIGDDNCHITSYGPARNTEAFSASLPANRVLVSQPMLVRIEIPFDTCPNITLGSDADLPPYNIIINLGYEQVDVDRLGVSEGSLRLMRFSPGIGWFEVQTAALNPDLNLLIGTISRDGIFAVGAVVP